MTLNLHEDGMAASVPNILSARATWAAAKDAEVMEKVYTRMA